MRNYWLCDYKIVSLLHAQGLLYQRWSSDLGSKPTCTILLCSWERHFTFSPAWWSWQADLKYIHIFITLQEDSNILAFPEAGWVIAYTMY